MIVLVFIKKNMVQYIRPTTEDWQIAKRKCALIDKIEKAKKKWDEKKVRKLRKQYLEKKR